MLSGKSKSANVGEVSANVGNGDKLDLNSLI